MHEHSVDLATNHQAVRHDFAKMHIHGRLTHWLQFPAEYYEGKLAVCDKVLVAKSKARGTLKISPFKSRWLSLCDVVAARYPLNDLVLQEVKRTR